MIHCIGDSHSAVFSGEEKMQDIWPMPAANTIPFFSSYRIGPATAFQLANKKEIIDSIISKVYKNGDHVMFCFGEVDIRAHLIKQSQQQNRDILEIVNECVERYFNVILEYKNRGVSVLVWGPIASWNNKKPYTGGPSFGTDLERNHVTKLFNEKLKEYCSQNEIKFVTLFYDMLNEDGTTNETYLDDWEGSHMHLSQRAMPKIIEKFDEQGLI